MRFNVLYFARLREVFSCAEEAIELPQADAKVADLIALLVARGGVWAEELNGSRVFRVAVDQEMADLQCPLAGAKEVAVFPPVTGG